MRPSWQLAACAALFSLSVSGRVAAADPSMLSPLAPFGLMNTEGPIAVEASALLPGSYEVVVELRSKVDVPLEGSIRTRQHHYLRREGSSSETPFVLAPKQTARVHINSGSSEVDLVSVEVKGFPPFEESVRESSRYGNMLVELSGTTQLTSALSNYVGVGGRQPQTATPPLLGSGERVMPRSFGGYAGVTTAHIPTGKLLELEPTELVALVDWVIRGGTLALSVDTNEHLGHTTLVSMLGGKATQLPGVARDFITAVTNTEGDPLRPNEGPPVPTLQQDTQKLRPWREGDPLPEAKTYVGGNLARTRFGDVAQYGTGRVVLLPFHAENEAQNPALLDLIDELTADGESFMEPRFSRLSRQWQGNTIEGLDPNQRFHLELGVVTLLLVLYGFAVALLLVRDLRRGRLFRMFVWVPALAGSIAVLVIGFGSVRRHRQRGVTRFMLVETGGGFSTASVDEYRGYFANSRDDLQHVTQTSGSLLLSDQLRPVQNRDGVSFLSGRPQLPWQLTQTRELRIEQSEEHIALGVDDQGPWVTNRTGATLEDLLLLTVSGAKYYLPRLGPTEHASAERWVLVTATGGGWNDAGLGGSPLSESENHRVAMRYGPLLSLVRYSSVSNASATSLLAIATGSLPMVRSQAPETIGDLPMRTRETFVHILGEGGER